MAGFETIVRPVVFPNIRPQSPRVLPPEDDPTQGFCTITSSGYDTITRTLSWSVSVSRSVGHVEQKRISDEVRVYQEEDDGTINRENFVDLRFVKGMRLVDPEGSKLERTYRPVDIADNIELRRPDIIDTYRQ